MSDLRSLLVVAFASAGLLAAAPALADAGSLSGHDDTTYPGHARSFASVGDRVVTPDVTYDGASTVVANTNPGPGDALAFDDATYSSGLQAAPEHTANDRPAVQGESNMFACGCPRS